MMKWLAFFLLALSFSISALAEDERYFHCPNMNDTKFPEPNVKLSKNWFGKRKLEVYAERVWLEVKLLNDNKLELYFEDGWGPTSEKACKDDPSVPLHCPTKKRILLSSFKGANGMELVRMHDYAALKCCNNRRIVNAGDNIKSSVCYVSKVLN